jgi:hypothetical protein
MKASDSNLAGWTVAVLSSDAGLSSVASKPITAGAEAGTISAPKTAAVSVEGSVASIALSDIVTSDQNATKHIYSDSSFSQNKDVPISLAVGADTHVYITVTAKDSTTMYYDVTVKRLIVYAVLKNFDDFAGTGTSKAIVDADNTKFVRLTLGGAEVASSGYNVAPGSTVITLSEAYLKTFANGRYVFKAEFADGVSGDIVLLVNVASGSPKTGDSAGLVALWLTVILSAAGLAGLLARKERLLC